MLTRPRPSSRSASAGLLCLSLLLTCPCVAGPGAMPWPPKYKIKAHETDRLTPADVLGPDGIVYPNWTKTGVQTRVATVETTATIEAYGGQANDFNDDAQALDQACKDLGTKGGGAVLLGEGTYYLDMPVTVRHDRVVIRGKGANKTRLIFRYGPPDGGIHFYGLQSGQGLGPNSRVELHCRPTGLAKMTIQIDNQAVRTWERSKHSGNTFSCYVRGRELLRKAPPGRHRLKGTAEYANGKQRTCELPILLDGEATKEHPLPSSRSAITFLGEGFSGPRLRLARDGKRGSLTLRLQAVEGLRKGDWLYIHGPATERWKALTRNKCKWGTYRSYVARIKDIDENAITLNQPLRIDFPIVDGSYVQKMHAITGCGIENLYMEQTENLWISTVQFEYAVECWARGVTVKKCGRHPIYGRYAKWCEISQCSFNDAWFKGGGGTAYVGWELSWDCLMEEVETFKMRHAPLFQWSASGNVIRQSVFHESDAQWHAGWTNENLMEQCVVSSVRGHGGYGYGMWASPPEDTAHGPNGPRNVVYNCDISSERTGLWMGGMNENWLILHNRFDVKRGQGIYARTVSFDHIIQDNVFILRDGKSPMMLLQTADCAGVELMGNRLYGGNGKFCAGKSAPLLLRDNQADTLLEVDRPKPKVASIYKWQQQMGQ